MSNPKNANKGFTVPKLMKVAEKKKIVLSLSLLHCELSVSLKEYPNRKKYELDRKVSRGQFGKTINFILKILFRILMFFFSD